MQGVQIKINNEWVVLPGDFSLKMEQTNPLFNEQGSFSFPFEVPIEENMHIFKNVSAPFGYIKLREIDGMEAEVWFDGVLLYKGSIETEDEIIFEHSIPLVFLSGVSDFMTKISDLNAQELSIDREIKLGYLVTKAESNKYINKIGTVSVDLPSHIMMNYTGVNISEPYPKQVYCNVRVCTSNEEGRYKVLDAKRPFSGVCFYIMYILDLLFSHLNINVRVNRISEIEDMCRLAIFSTQCNVKYSSQEVDISYWDVKSFVDQFSLDYLKIENILMLYSLTSTDFTYKRKDVFLAEKCLPNISIKDLIQDLQNAFGIRFLYDIRSNNMDIIYIKDILKENGAEELYIEILSQTVSKDKNNAIKLSYGDSDDTAFNYDDYSNVSLKNGYSDILKEEISAYNKTCYIDSITGNGYRVKVNKDTGGDPSLFEVGGFRDFVVGDKKTKIEDISIGFKPVIVNDVVGANSRQQVYAVFVDTELRASDIFKEAIIKIGEFKNSVKCMLTAVCPENFDTSVSNESPLRSYDAGYTLGIMRGPGNQSRLEYIGNYDGEGNDSWVQTADNYAFTSDTCDNYGSFFDYNGIDIGGIDQSGRISLKLIAEKENYPINSKYTGRGLGSKFMSEYLYFKANKRTIIFEVEIGINQIININLLKKYKIGYFVGFINKISYSISQSGVKDAQIELYVV